MRSSKYWFLPAAVSLVFACTDDGRSDTTSISTGISAGTDGPGDGDPSESNSADNGDGDPGDGDPTAGDGDPTGGDGDPSSSSGGPPKWDTIAVPDSNIPDLGCTKVDFMFVIDNSGSMSSYQNNLVANYPAFITNIQNSLDSVNEYQVGILTTDAYSYNLAQPANCQSDLAALVGKTGGGNSSNATCAPFNDGYNFMTENDDLQTEFNCAARVGTSGNGYELTMDALLGGVDEHLDYPGGCNEEFLREDSLLVLIIVTDEADGLVPFPDPEANFNQAGTSMGDPQSWFDAVVAARGDIETNVVVVSFINYNGGQCPPSSDYYNGENIKQFTEMFTYGYLAGICEPDYGPVLMQAISVIDEACDNYISPG